jgi:hypothetical protein
VAIINSIETITATGKARPRQRAPRLPMTKSEEKGEICDKLLL